MQFKIYVRGIICNSEGKVLLALKQPDQKIAGGKWVFPGGTVEFGESPEETLKRELQEEINFTPEDPVLVGTETIVLDDTHWLGLFYRVKGDTGRLKNMEPEKHVKIEWCTVPFAKENVTDEATRCLERP